MRSITFFFISLSLATSPVWAGGVTDTPQVSTPKFTDERPINPRNCEDQFGNRGARFCRTTKVSESYFLGQVSDRKTKKPRKYDQ